MTKLTSPPLSERGLGWRYDLPHVGEEPKVSGCLDRIKPPPNYYDAIYLELPRQSVSLRGVVALLGVPSMLLCLGVALWLYWGLLFEGFTHDWVTNVLTVIFPVLPLWVILCFIKLDLTVPRDEPIRFNRLRRKIYLYQFRFHYMYLFSPRHWGVKPVAYNWDDVTAEVYRIYAPGHGGLIENVMLSVRNPETNEVIDRVFFSHDLYHGEAYWAIARLFMQQGPEALPKFVHPARDWNDDDGLSHMHCLAPKVYWPVAIDRESRTAPHTGEVQ
ncbi:DUF6708 domain-containing protein [Pseudomonas juntendi]|uniref:DUF6708 domain-containing protein n=1 Tax=Pseudomonas juntendi TaxID=2666183 RepID=UPI00217547F0|nr:DUF6708 domain-containing protein [Pseudomonas juntendi]